MTILFTRSFAIILGTLIFVLTCLLWYGTTLVRLPTGFATRYYAGVEWKALRAAFLDERVSTADVRRNWPRTDELLAVRWDSYLRLNRTGVYRFSLISDHGTRFYLDDRLVLDNIEAQSMTQLIAELPLDRGVHTLRLESAPAGKPFSVELLWATRSSYRLSSLTGSVVSAQQPGPQELVLRVAKDGIRTVAIGTWIVLYGAAILGGCVVPAVKALIRHHAPNGLPTAVVALLGLSAALYLGAITWGLPGPGWAIDEVSPVDLLRAVDGSFYREWWSQNPKYPPAHFYLLGLTLPPFLVWRWLDPTAFVAAPTLEALLVIFRAVSVAMAVSVVLMVYLCGTYLYNARSALVAAALVALPMPMVYHAKVAALDIPYVFWFSLSLPSFVRMLTDDSPLDYLLFGSCAALAVCTKDQAYGLYGLPIVALVCLSYTRAAGGSPIRRLAAVCGRRDLLFAFLLTLAVFALCQNLLFNPGGFLFHLRYITGPGAGPFRMFQPTVEGQWQLWQATWMLVRVSFGWPAFLLCVFGIALSLWRPEAAHKRLWWVLLPAASYYVTFLAVIGYTYDRFLLPVFIVLCLAGGFCVSRLERAARLRWATRGAVAGVLGYSVVYAIAVNVAMLRDSRYTAESWIRANVGAGATIGAIGPADHLPRTPAFVTRYVSPNVEWLRVAPVDYIVVNVDWVGRFRPGLPEHDLYRDLRDGRLGYQQVFEARTSVRFAGMQFDDRFEPFGSTGYSALTKLNSPIAVFKRAP